MKNNNTIVFAGCKDTTLECMSSLIQAGYKIDLLITITSELAQKNMVAGFMDFRSLPLKIKFLFTLQIPIV